MPYRHADTPPPSCRRTRTSALVAGVAALATLLLLARRRMRRWGATADEVLARLPGDELIPDPVGQTTFATTLPAPPERVWPWLIQMGADRGGFYSWDRLDNAGHASATAIEPSWQDLREGDRILSRPDGSSWFEVALLEQATTLVLRARLDAKGRPTTAPEGDLRFVGDSIWSFHLQPVPEGTRLLVRGRGGGKPRHLHALGNAVFWDPAHWIMQTKQFRELRRRVASA
ncbi:hypothetical protein Q5424_10085 [Conexibacter sp. JD483]|uniref:hypothetical protein n=1 Tax=unclassified Conexibacter TaxID=2627773 RepID=UPI002719D8A9|nr:MULTISPECIES: hypothetical protein [unclassified Conexibacter]MDO8188346.1 hypothetical protein [Conexibacter sp. CPCC 205706]MDO8200706.1 hypothetical protein [Conexibacter sp. CPCC 205762]MDR9369430.1 hypothetical protein [Conexibacter sp. JD483]